VASDSGFSTTASGEQALRDRLRGVLSLGARLAISVFLLWFVVSRVGLDTLLGHLRGLHPAVLLAAVLLSVAGVGISAVKWRVLLSAKGISLSVLAAWIYYYIGQFFNAFLPSVIGGDSARMYYLYAHTNNGTTSVSSVVVERLLGLYSILCVVVVGLLVGSDLVPGGLAGAVLLGCAVGIVVLPAALFTEWFRPLLGATVFRVDTLDVGRRLERVYTDIYSYRDARRALFVALLLSFLFRVALVLSNYVVAMGLSIDVPLVYFFVFIPLVELLLFLPISIQGFGVRETAYLYVFGAVGVADGLALAFGVVMQLILQVVNNLIGGVVYFLYGFRS
jgi:hypothetical protein